jgi:hypothetical protein
MVSFILNSLFASHWVYLHAPTNPLPDWGDAAQLALELLLPHGFITYACRDSTLQHSQTSWDKH